MEEVNDAEVVGRAVAVLGGHGIRAVRRDPRGLVLVAKQVPGAEHVYRLEVRARLTGPLASVIDIDREHPTLVVAPFVADPAAEVLRERGVDYVDLAGNVLLRWDGLLIDIRGRKPGHEAATPVPQALRRPFTRSGAQVTFCLLVWPDLVDRSVRELARVSGTSLGSVHAVLRDLEDGGYLLTGPHTRALARTGELLDRWTEAYALSLSASLHLGYYRTPDPLWWRDARDDLRVARAELGGEAAASVLDDRLRPAGAIVYAAEVPAQVLAKYRCRRAVDAADANVTVRRRFWADSDSDPERVGVDGDGLTPAVLIYADLLVSGDPRQREHAHRLRALNDRLTHLDRS